MVVPSLQVRIINNIVYQQNDTHNLVGLTQSERVGYRELFSQVVTQPVNPIYVSIIYSIVNDARRKRYLKIRPAQHLQCGNVYPQQICGMIERAES